MSVNTENKNPVAIVGIGCLFPKAENARRFWANIKNGVDAITEVPPSHWLPEDYFDSNPKSPDRTYARKGGFLLPVDFDPSEFGMAPNALEATDSAQLLGLLAAKMALADAGYGAGAKEFDRATTSVILGVTGTLELVIPLGARLGHPKWRKALAEFGITGADAEAIISRMQEDYVPWQESSFPGLLGNVVSGRIANRFNLGGTNCTVDAACGSSLSAVHMATMELMANRASMVITGGVDCFNDIFMYMCFSKTPALSPSGDAKPFDANGDGTTLGEGLGMMALKRLEDARRDGDRIYAVIKGVGSSSDGKGKAIYAPSADGQTRALRTAYAVTGVAPETVELVEAHGTGTTVGDGVEVEALNKIYGSAGKKGRWCALGSVKSMLGHTKAAAGSAGMIKAALSLYNKTLPPTIKVTKPLKQLESDTTPFYLNTELRPWVKTDHPRRAAVSALGFGGSNFHAILEEYTAQKPQPDWDGDVQLVAISGDNAQALAGELNSWKNLSWDETRVKAMQSRAAFNPAAKARISFVLENGQDNAKVINAAIAGLETQKSKASWNLPEGIFFSTQAPQKLAVLFPGQGAQYPYMQRDIVCRFPQALQTLETANAAFGDDDRLSDYIYPRPAFTPEAKQAQSAALTDTRIAQPALGAVSLGAYRALQNFGVEGDAFAGHSYGELAALCAAGAFDEATLFALSKLRGELMAQGEGDRGSMLAIKASLAEVEKFVADEKLDLTIANKNTPSQFVLSGRTDEIERAAKCCKERKLRGIKLTVSAAFHSPLVAGAQKEFAAALTKINFNAPQKPVYANKTATAYPSDAGKARELLSSQLACPVEFVSLIQNMYADGIRIFLEAGPGARLTGMVDAILEGREHTALAIDASSGKRSGIAEAARALACLAAAGLRLNLSAWENGEAGVADVINKKVSKLSVKLTGANYRTPRPANAPKPQPRKLNIAQNVQPAPQPQMIAGPAEQRIASDALRITQDSMIALQKLQEQTAILHARFLEGQENAQRSFQALVEQQKQLFGIPASPAVPVQQTAYVPQPLPTFTAPVIQPVQQPAAAPVAAKPAQNNVEPILLAVVSGQTGYPVESLNPDMDMESDLGIDSIKRVAILSELQSKLPDAPKITPEQLGNLRTLRQIMECLAKNASGPAQAAQTSTPAGNTGELQNALLSVVASQTGYPVESLNPDMDMESDLGIDSIKRVAILSELQSKFPNAPKITAEQLGNLRTLRQIMECLVQPGGQAAISVQAAQPAIAGGELQNSLLSIVASQTGYPVESLNPDMDMESDLGIDSIKRVAILSELQSKFPDAPKITAEQLGNLRTLRQIMACLVSAQPTPVAAPSANTNLESALLSIVAAQTGYPVESLNPDMDMESDLGIDSIKRVAILSELQSKFPDAPKITAEQLGNLRTLRQIMACLVSAQPAVAAPVQAAQPEVKKQARPECEISRQILKAEDFSSSSQRPAVNIAKDMPILVTDDGSALADATVKNLRERGYAAKKISIGDTAAAKQPELGGLVIIAPAEKISPSGFWSKEAENFLKKAFLLAQAAGSGLRAAGKKSGTVAGTPGSCLMTVSRMDGIFGLSGLKAEQNPVYGGLAGLAKTAGHEWREVSCRALDMAAEWNHTASMAQTVADEIFLKSPAELGVGEAGRKVVLLAESEQQSKGGSLPLAKGDVVLVTGGARGVTAEAAAALAKACKPVIALLGRSPLPNAEESWLAACATEADIKKALIARNSGMTPKIAGEQCKQILASREIRAQLNRFEREGSRAVYYSADVRDKNATAAVLGKIRAELGTVRGLVHGAGVLADKFIADKTKEQFDFVFDTKVDGLINVLSALDLKELRMLALYSSSTARFGRTGQCDYSMANEVLNKTARLLARRLPDCRVTAFNWGPWDGGMVNDALRSLFEKEGIGVIGLESGGRFLVDEMSSLSPAAEVVVLGKLPGAAPQNDAPQSAQTKPAFDVTVSTQEQPFLNSHIINGKAVLPTAIITEWLAHAAMHSNPGLAFIGFNNLRIFKGVILDGGERKISARAAKAVRKDGAFAVYCELRGPADELHAGAEILLANAMPKAEAPQQEFALSPYPRRIEKAYCEVLFHGEDLQVIRTVCGVSGQGIIFEAAPALPPRSWMRHPLRDRWLADPAALDAAFQAMILWTFENSGACSLPNGAAAYRQYASFPSGGTRVIARVTASQEHAAKADIDFTDGNGNLVARMSGYECTVDKSLNAAFRKNSIVKA